MRIGELAERAGTSPKTIRYYEAINLIPEPPRLPNGYRDYGERSVERLRFVRSAQAIGLSLDEIRDVLDLRDGGAAPCTHVLELIDCRAAELGERVRVLESMREQLLKLARESGRSFTYPATFCHIIESADLSIDSHVVPSGAPPRRA